MTMARVYLVTDPGTSSGWFWKFKLHACLHSIRLTVKAANADDIAGSFPAELITRENDLLPYNDLMLTRRLMLEENIDP
jgi:hypothetical protein